LAPLLLGSPPRFSGMKTVAGSGCTLSGGGGEGGDVGLSAMTSAYSEGDRPEHRLNAERQHGGLEGELEPVDGSLVRAVAVARAVGDAQLGLGNALE